MKLHRLRLVNFRQHADTEIAFGDGITGIIGPNGSGKTSLLEAIAWAIYGNAAARGDKDSIRNLRAKARAPMRVELEFSLGNRTYVVERKLNEATLHENGIVVANSIKEVTARLQRVLGMTHDEFFNTYFTGQKELAVLADATRPERAAFLSRVLRHEQLTVAQEHVRERRNALGHEVDGLETGLPPQSELEKERKAAEARLGDARKAATAATTERQKAQQTLAEEEPRWQQWVERRERTLSLHGDLRVAEQGVIVARQEFQRLDKELAEALGAREELRKLDADVAPITKLKAELVELDRLHREDAARREDQAKITELARNLSVLDRRIAELADAEAALGRATSEARALAVKLESAEKLVEEHQAAWVREKEAAGTRRKALLEQFEEVKKHRDDIERLGPEGQCPTCRRPLGAEHSAVLGELEEQLELIVEDGKWLKQRLEQLAETPAAVAQAEAAHDVVREEVRAANEREGNLRAQETERIRIQKERAGLAKRTAEMERRVAERDGGYDAARHNEVRAELARLEPVALQAAALKARADRAEALVSEAELAEKSLSAREEQVKQLAAAVQEQGFSEPKFQAARERHDRAAHALRAAELAVAESRGELVAAETAVREAERRVKSSCACTPSSIAHSPSCGPP
jgi:exonuclease SbcC